MKPSRRRAKAGFTLVEMIVAVFILSVAVVAAIEAFTTVTRVNSKGQAFQTSALLAQQRFSEIEQEAASLSGGDQQGDFVDPYSDFRWQQNVEATDYPQLFKVTLTISWGSGPQPEQRVFTTYIRTDQNTTDQQIRDQQQSSSQGGGGGGTGG